MIKVTGTGSITTCDGITRRDFLQVGALGAIGLSLSQMAALKAMGNVSKGKDERAAIMIFNLGAPSQIDTFDMKPDAPAEIRDPFKPSRPPAIFKSPRFFRSTRNSRTSFHSYAVVTILLPPSTTPAIK